MPIGESNDNDKPIWLVFGLICVHIVKVLSFKAKLWKLDLSPLRLCRYIAMVLITDTHNVFP